MSGSNDNTKVTSQGSFLELFEDDDLKSIVSQIEGGTGTRKAKILFGVGFASVPVESDRLVCTEIGNGLYALGGSCESVIESLSLSDGERCIFSTDETGAIQSKTVWKNDGTVQVGNGSEFVALSNKVDALWEAFNDMFTAWTPAANDGGAALKSQFEIFFASPPQSVASTNLKAD